MRVRVSLWVLDVGEGEDDSEDESWRLVQGPHGNLLPETIERGEGSGLQ